jgi:hypothetical protein
MAARLAPARVNEMTEAKADISCKGVIIWSRDRVWDPTKMHVAVSLRANQGLAGRNVNCALNA